MESQRREFILTFISLVLLVSQVKSIGEADGPVTIVPNNTLKLNCSVGQNFNLQFSGRSLLPGISSYRFNISNLPLGLHFTPLGVLSGICQIQGNYTFIVSITTLGLTNITVNESYKLTILPVVQRFSLPNGYVGIPYSSRITLNQKGFNGIWMRWNIPSWLIFNSATQIISGIPPFPGNYSFSIGYNSSGGLTNSSFLLIVLPNTLEIIPSSISVKTNNPQKFNFTGRNGTYPYNIRFHNLPSWLTSTQNTLMYNGQCLTGNITINAIITDLTNTSNMFNVSVLCMSDTILSGLSPFNVIGSQRGFVSTSFPINSISPNSIQMGISPSPPLARALPVLPPPPVEIRPKDHQPFNILSNVQYPINQNPIKITPLTQIFDVDQFVQGLSVGGNGCPINPSLPSPYSGSSTIVSVNYQNNYLILQSGQVLLFRSCTQISNYNNVKGFHPGNTVTYLAQRDVSNQTDSLNKVRPPQGISLLLSINNGI